MITSRVKTIDGWEPVNAYTWDAAALPALKFQKKRQARRSYQYATDYAVLDTETSHKGEAAGWIYQWAFLIRGVYIVGRTPSELLALLVRLKEAYELSAGRRIIIYIHNQSYDMQYLKRFLWSYDPDMEVMATDAHSYLITDVCGFRILCSYRLSNLSLAAFADAYADKYRKAVGEIDYSIIRYQDSELTAEDWEYMLSDVASQHDAIRGYLSANGYKYAYQAPFTQTGFVRTDCRHRSERALNSRKHFKKSALTADQYILAHMAFMGGITICSYRYAGRTVREGDRGVPALGHVDFTSSYPARQMLDYFPIGKPMWYGPVMDRETLDLITDKYCCIFILHLKDVHIKPGVTAPYIPSSKCIGAVDLLKVNGKVVYAAELSIAVTEIDYKIILRQYDFEGEPEALQVMVMKRGPLPDWLKGAIMSYFKTKCEEKGRNPRLYAADKQKLNGIYGMSATAIVRDCYTFTGDCMLEKEEGNIQDQVSHFYNSRNSFLPYQWGVYTTAHARAALIDMIEAVGYENFLYCDTDSVFYIKTPEAEARLQEYAERCRDRAVKAGAYIGDSLLGYPTPEPDIRAFRGLHSKCYAMEEATRSGDYALRVTIAGIPKRTIKWIDGKPVSRTNAEELGSIDNLRDGFIFRHCGGTRSLYIEDDIHIEEIDGHRTEYAASCIIEDIEKEISDTMWTRGKDYTIISKSIQTIL